MHGVLEEEPGSVFVHEGTEMTYTELQAKIAAWLNRTDLTAIIPDFISLTEERINRHLRVRQMEVAMPLTTIVDNLITPPAGTVDVKTLWLDGYEATPLKIQTFESAQSWQTDGLTTLFAWKGTDLYFNGSGEVRGVLYEQIPSLADEETTWLSESAPSVYLFGGLMEASLYLRKDASTWESRFKQALDEIAGNDKRYNGPLVARAR